MHGLYLLWWVQEKGMPPAVVAAVLAAGDLALLGLELPTGWLADKYGHRSSLVLGSLVQVAGMLWCWLGDGAAGLVIASALVALGDAFRSGAGDALLYRSCVALDREDSFHALQSRATALETASLVLLILAGGLIVGTWGFAAGWIAETLLCTAGLGIAFAMEEPPAAGDDDSDSEQPAATRRAFSIRFAILIVPASVLGGMAGAGSFLVQTTGTADAGAVTLVVAAIALAEAAGSAAAARLPPGGARAQTTLAALGAAVFITGLVWPPIFTGVVVTLSFLDGLSHPLRTTAIQRACADGARARMASAASACDMAISAIALPLAGLMAARR